MAYVQIKGYAPDADPVDAGSLPDCDNLIPTLNGMKSFPSDVSSGAATLAAVVNRLFSVVLKDGVTRRTFASNKNTIYELNSNAWTSRNGEASNTAFSGGVSMTGSPQARFSFAQYEDGTYAVHKGVPLLVTSGTASFTRVTSAPRANIVEVVQDFVFLFDIDDSSHGPTTALGAFGDSPNRWWCSAQGQPDSWTLNIATQATSGRLPDTPGRITAARRLGNNIVVYKQQHMYLGRYVGVPKVWEFSTVPGDGLGTWSKNSVIDIESAHLFAGYDNFYLFDGTRPTPIATNRVAQYFLDTLNFEHARAIQGYHDRVNWRVFWWYPSGNALDNGYPILDRYLCYNYRSDRWGAGVQTVRAVADYRAGGVTYDQLDGLFGAGGLYDELPTASYDDWLKTSGGPIFGLMRSGPTTTTHSVLANAVGTGVNSYMETNDFGADDRTTVVRRVRPRFRTRPATGSQTHYIKNIAEAAQGEQVSQTTTLSDQGSFDHVYAGRWHRFRHDYSGDVEISGVDIEIEEDGQE